MIVKLLLTNIVVMIFIILLYFSVRKEIDEFFWKGLLSHMFNIAIFTFFILIIALIWR